MRRVVLTVLAATCALAVSVGAQNVPSQSAPAGQENITVPAPDKAPAEQGDSKGATQGETPTQTPTRTERTTPPPAATMKVTGCIEAGTQASTFKLTNIVTPQTQTQNKPATPAVGTSGTATSYDLTASSGVDLSKHVGHKVELTGRVMPAASAATSGAGATSGANPAYGAPSGTGARPGTPPSTTGTETPSQGTSTARTAAAPMPMFSVTEVKMISSSCTP